LLNQTFTLRVTGITRSVGR